EFVRSVLGQPVIEIDRASESADLFRRVRARCLAPSLRFPPFLHSCNGVGFKILFHSVNPASRTRECSIQQCLSLEEIIVAFDRSISIRELINSHHDLGPMLAYNRLQR